MADLAQHLRELPQELFDLIYDFTFSSDTAAQTITENYKPPPELCVDAVSRDKFAKSCYSKSFYIAHENHETVATKWLCFLPQTHIDMIARIVVHKLYAYETSCDCFVPEQSKGTLARFRLKDWKSRLKLERLHIPFEKLHVRIFGKVWSFDSYRNLKAVADGYGMQGAFLHWQEKVSSILTHAKREAAIETSGSKT